MSIKVDRDWWKTLFDEVYLITDARSVCDETVTRLEVDVICELLPVRPEHKILDLCGGHGRHSLELCTRGFTGCTVVDYSQCLIDHAASKASECNYTMDCIRSDARNMGLPSETFDHVWIMGNSLGYIQEPDADSRIIAEAYRLLRRGGRLLVDVTDAGAVKKRFKPVAWHEIGDDTVVCRKRELHGDVVRVREVVLSKEKGLIRDRTYAVRFYEPQTLEDLFKRAGFTQIKIHTDFSPHPSKGDYGFMNHRMIATGRKP